MIRLNHIFYHAKVGKKRVALLNDVVMEFPDNAHVAVLYKPGADRNSLVKIIYGAMVPDAGHCHITGRVSWPANWHQIFSPHLTLVENVSFICRVYGYNVSEALAFIAEFSGLEKELNYKVTEISGETKLKIFFLTTLSIPFDHYIFEGDFGFGIASPEFKKTCKMLAAARMETSSCILVTHAPSLAKQFNYIYAMGSEGMKFFSNSADAIQYFSKPGASHIC